MKKQLIKRRAHALAVAMTLAAGVFTLAVDVSVKAQGQTSHTGQPPQSGQRQSGQTQTGHTGHMQSGDMPYDLHFIDMMMMHHQQGIEMARLAEGKAQNARVKAFAAKTAADQEKDIQKLQWHRDNHYPGRPKMDHQQMMAHMQSMMPGHENMMMDMEADLAKLRAASGREFDRLFLDTMIPHHQMAIDMSKDAVAKAQHAEIKELARQAIAKQQAEIAEMNRIKAGLGGSTRKTKAPVRKAKPKAAHKGHTGH